MATPSFQALQPEQVEGQLGLLVARRGPLVWLEVNPKSCLRCASGKGCGAALLGRTGARRLRVNGRSEWQLGQRVALPTLDQPLPRLAWLAYGAPLLGLFAGLLLSVSISYLLPLGPAGADASALVMAAAGAWLGGKILQPTLTVIARRRQHSVK